jgi:hypothetical protein
VIHEQIERIEEKSLKRCQEGSVEAKVVLIRFHHNVGKRQLVMQMALHLAPSYLRFSSA